MPGQKSICETFLGSTELESADSRIGGERGEGFHNRVQRILLFFRILRKRTLRWVQNLNLCGKSAYHVFANNCFGTFFKNFFNGFEICVF
jgi:hypothetical protein